MNPEMRFDLHTHTTASDGTLSPAELVALAGESGLGGLAITDHDTLDGIAEGLREGAKRGILVIPGVEISTDGGDHEVHILALLVDTDNPSLNMFLKGCRGSRHGRVEAIVERLRGFGVDMDMDTVLGIAGGGSVGRPHVADALIAGGYAADREEAFDNYLTPGKPGFVPRSKPTPEEAIKTIREAKGIPVLAHPGFEGVDRHIVHLASIGLMGLEARHPSHTPEVQGSLEVLAARLGLLVTGGSDSHGPGSGGSGLGARSTTSMEVENLIRRRSDLYGSHPAVDFFAWRSMMGIR